MHFDASAVLEAKLDRVRDLLRHCVPNGDLAAVVERAVDQLLATLEKERLGKTSRPQRVQRPTKPGRIARATRRATASNVLSSPKVPRAAPRGRCSSSIISRRERSAAANLRVRGRAHNRLHAEHVFGSEHVKRRIDERQRASRRRQERAEETTAALCLRGLANTGFAEAKARRVVALVTERRGADRHASFEALREALAALT